MIAKTPEPPYYAVIFSSLRAGGDNGYNEMAQKMEELSSQQEGFLGIESARGELGITVCYWQDLASIQKWKHHAAHLLAQQKGKEIWYKGFQTRIAKIERDYNWENPELI